MGRVLAEHLALVAGTQLTTERNNRGNRQGAALLASWLPRLLADEATSLQLGRYLQQPEDMPE